jgi:glycolate oxidase
MAQADAEKIVELCKSHGASTARRAASEEERERFWSLRRALSPAVYALGRVKINEDICVPRTRLAEMLAITQDISRRYSLPIVNFGHAGDGSLHVNVVLERDDPALRARAEEAVGEIFASAIKLGGTLSAEHGIGITKARFLDAELGTKEMAVMARIKKLFDPNGILNPGKFTDVLSSHE